jgi:hypothetical protein
MGKPSRILFSGLFVSVGAALAQPLGDVDGNGETDPADAEALMDLLLGMR